VTRCSISSAGPALLAIDPDVVCTGELTEIDAASWTLRLGHFLIGDLHRIIAFIDGFGQQAPENRYVLSNELGNGRADRSADPHKAGRRV
jgi:hypothetical protein